MDAARILGVSDVEFLGYMDSEVPDPKVLRRDLIRIFRTYGPDLVITVDPYLPYEAHPDHVNTGLAVLQAVLFHNIPRVVREYRSTTSPPAVALGATHLPNAVVCIDDVADRKINALRAHKSQFSEDAVRLIMRISEAIGRAVGCRYGEAFRVLLHSEVHMNILAQY